MVGMVPRTARPEAADKKRRRAAQRGVVIGNTKKYAYPCVRRSVHTLQAPSMGAADIAQCLLKARILLIDVGVKIHFTTIFDNGCTVGNQHGYGMFEFYGA